jgi:two-component system nitrogen regulation sensor histidine kinase NtrY
LKIINNQIKQIGNLVNEFSDFARMPKPVLKKNDLIEIIHENIRLLSEIDSSIKINLDNKKPSILFRCDKEQISRVIFNLIKNSIESIQQKAENTSNFNKIITIEIFERNNQICIIITDSGLGFKNIKNNIKDILNPYFTTKKNGTGLGLSIVNKIINDHNGEINFVSIPNGAKIEIVFN